ncbi:unnamed protein product [Victoria cruziana]
MITHQERYPQEDLGSSIVLQKDVSYSCGSCGYALNLRSSNRNTSNIDSKYGKSLKKGIISFLYVDESKFTQIDELKCLPHFLTKRSWGLLQPRTKLLCRKCGNLIGYAYEETIPPLGSAASDSSSGVGMAMCRKYRIKIRALQPCDEASLPFIL